MPIVGSNGAHQADPPPPAAAECSGNNNNNAVTEQLDPEVWQKLPHELLEKVHLCLPLCSLARFRSVCTAWNRVVFEEGFIRVRHDLITQKPWIVVTSTANSVSVYDSGAETWLTFPMPFNAHNLHVVAAAGGLLCFSNGWFQWPTMAVLNPVTNTWRRLPPLHTWMITTVGMVYFEDSQTYKIFVCGRMEDHSMITELYDSAIDTWVPGGLPSAARRYGGDSLVWLDGIFYCLTFPYSTLSLIAYDLMNATWHEVPVEMPLPIMSPTVVVCGVKLFLVGGMDEPVFRIMIWEMDFEQVVWVDVEAMPVQMCLEFEAKMAVSKPLSCFSTGDQIFLSTPCTSAYLPAVFFDVKEKTWNWWPAGGFPPNLPQVNMGRSFGIGFEPRLHARA